MGDVLMQMGNEIQVLFPLYQLQNLKVLAITWVEAQ